MFLDCRRYSKTLEGKRFSTKNFKRKEKGHGEKFQRIGKTYILVEQLIHVLKGNTGEKLEEWPVVMFGECLIFLFKDDPTYPNQVISVLYRKQIIAIVYKALL